MALPVFTVQWAPTNGPNATTYTWVDMSAYVSGLSYQRGRQNELNRIDAGTGSLTLNDPDSIFDPRNTASPLYPNVKPEKPLRVRATIGGTTYELFQHFVQSWPRAQRIANVYTQRSVTTVDGFELLARAGLTGKSYSVEASGTRVGNVLTDAGWASGRRDVDAGQSTLAAISFVFPDDTRARDHLQDVAESENGLFFIDGRGYARFIQRWNLISSPYTTSEATLSDSAVGSQIGYIDVLPSSENDLLLNDWTGQRSGGAVQTITESASITSYGRRSQSFTLLVTTDSDVLSALRWKLSQYKDPLERIESVTVKPGQSTAAWQALFGLELGDRVTVKETPPGFSSAISADYRIQQLSVSVPTDVADAAFTFALWPSPPLDWFILGNATLGKLNYNKVGY